MGDKLAVKDPFGQRIKEYEKESETYLNKSKYTIIRIDGHGFSKWTKGFDKPFDDLLVQTLSEVAKSLMDEFKAVVAYSQSDEITLILEPDDNMIYSGRVQKITSLMASFASMKFNNLLQEEWHEMNRWFICGFDRKQPHDIRQELLASKIGKAFFDARVFQVDSASEAFNALLWRTRDCERNSKNVFAQSKFSHKECMNKTSDELVEMCRNNGYIWEELPDQYKFGILWKKELYLKELEDGSTCTRTKFIQFSNKLNYSEENVDFILKKKI